MYPTIDVDLQSTKFFITIAKKDAHSFVMIGIYDGSKVERLLVRVGKFFDIDPSKTLGCLFLESVASAVLGHADAHLHDEGLVRKAKDDLISYQAYDLSFDQYLHFLQILESLQTTVNTFTCYKPICYKEGKVTLAYTKQRMMPPKKLSSGLDASVHQLSIDNNCRHSAIALVQEVLGSFVPSLLSTFFLNELPYHTYLDHGMPSAEHPFYVLPPPPVASLQVNKKQRAVLEQLYHRMEHLLMLEPDSLQTQEKFFCLKELYTELLGTTKELSVDELLLGIQLWKKKNFMTLQTLRKTYPWDFFVTRTSATLRAIEDIENDLHSNEDDKEQRTDCISLLSNAISSL